MAIEPQTEYDFGKFADYDPAESMRNVLALMLTSNEVPRALEQTVFDLITEEDISLAALGATLHCVTEAINTFNLLDTVEPWSVEAFLATQRNDGE